MTAGIQDCQSLSYRTTRPDSQRPRDCVYLGVTCVVIICNQIKLFSEIQPPADQITTVSFRRHTHHVILHDRPQVFQKFVHILLVILSKGILAPCLDTKLLFPHISSHKKTYMPQENIYPAIRCFPRHVCIYFINSICYHSWIALFYRSYTVISIYMLHLPIRQTDNNAYANTQIQYTDRQKALKRVGD